MAHLRYGDRNYPLPDDRVEEVKEAILSALKANGVATLGLADNDGANSLLYITRGVPVVVNDWDTDLQ